MHTPGHHDGSDPDCFGCRVKHVQVSPAAMPTRRNSVPPRVSDTANNWEKGIPTDRHGMPYLDRNCTPVGIKQWSAERSSFERKLRAERAASVNASSSPKEP